MSEAVQVVRGVAGEPMRDPAVARELALRYLVFDGFVSGRPRVDVQPLLLSAPAHEQAMRTAEGVVRALDATARCALATEDERRHYGFHVDVERLAAASHEAGDDGTLARVDLLWGDDQRFHACEVNADCPGGHNETLALPTLARAHGFRGGYNPTRIVDATAARLAALAQRPDGSRGAVALLYATAYAEDLQVCALLRRAVEQRGVRAILAPPTALVPREGGLALDGHDVTALYRYYPTEYMEGDPNVPAIVDAVSSGRVRTLANFAQMYLQSKLVMARGWARIEGAAPEDAEAIREHVPFTLDLADAEATLLVQDRADWVLKKTLGRVGDEVFVGALEADADWRALVAELKERRRGGERWIAQRFVPQRPVPTPWGPRLVTLGAYVLDGRFAGYFARLTSVSHVSHDALVVPVFVQDDG
jgi:glutathionylspermidine synthase